MRDITDYWVAVFCRVVLLASRIELIISNIVNLFCAENLSYHNF